MKLFSQTHFAGSFLSSAPPTFYNAQNGVIPECAVLGKSNVGKSSFINHLCNKSLAKVSSTPGKTQTLNFFIVDDVFALVDVPGYGFAKVPGSLKSTWAECLDNYLCTRDNLSLLLLLLDSRRIPSEEDLSFIEWARSNQKELLLIFTKVDKLRAHEKELLIRNAEKTFGSLKCFYYTIQSPEARQSLIYHLQDILWENSTKKPLSV